MQRGLLPQCAEAGASEGIPCRLPAGPKFRQQAVFISAQLLGFHVFRPGATCRAKAGGLKVKVWRWMGVSLLARGSSPGSWIYSAVPGGLVFSLWWFPKCLICRQPLACFSSGTVIDRSSVSWKSRAAWTAGLQEIFYLSVPLKCLLLTYLTSQWKDFFFEG